MSEPNLRQVVRLLDATDAHELHTLERHERRRLADQFRAWAYVAEYGVPAPPRKRKPAPKSGVLAALYDGERAP